MINEKINEVVSSNLQKEKSVSYVRPLMFFWISHILCYYLPSLYLIDNRDEFFLDESVENTYKFINLVYLLVILIVPNLLNQLVYRRFPNFNFLQKVQTKSLIVFSKKIIPVPDVIVILITLMSIFSIIVFIVDGIPKYMLLGTDIDSWTFRIIGYDDRNRIYSAILEIVRRILFPLTFFYLLINYHANKENIFNGLRKSTIYLYFVCFSYLLISILGLDRGPIFLFIAILSYFFFIKSNSDWKKILIGIVTIVLISFSGGLFTYLQYNITDFTVADLLNQSSIIIIKRVVLDPAYASYILSFEKFPEGGEFLYMRYARISAIVTGSYTPTEGVNSIYVSPCGLVGDMWRNFGTPGVVIFSSIVSGIFWYIDNRCIKLDFFIQTPVSILSIIVSMYLLFGTLFSFGPIGLLIVISFISGYYRTFKKIKIIF